MLLRAGEATRKEWRSRPGTGSVTIGKYGYPVSWGGGSLLISSSVQEEGGVTM